MSDQAEEFAELVTQRLASTLGELLAETGGGMVTGFALAANYIDRDGDRAYLVSEPSDQDTVVTLGLIRFHQMSAEAELNAHFKGDDQWP